MWCSMSKWVALTFVASELKGGLHTVEIYWTFDDDNWCPKGWQSIKKN